MPQSDPAPLASLLEPILHFRAERDWQRFHTPKNLAISLSLEAAELLEHYQWTDPPSGPPAEAIRPEIEQEVADIAMYLLLFCHDQGIDLPRAIEQKLALNRQRYPVELARGQATKYTKLKPPE